MRNVRFAVAALLASCSSAWGGDITFTPQLFDNVGFNVNVTYGPNGSLPGGTNENTSSSPQIDTSGSILGPVYCSDLWHGNFLGNQYLVDAHSSLSSDMPADIISDASDRIGWILSHSPSNTDTSLAAIDERGAMQLAIWYTVDSTNSGSGFSYTGGDSGMQADYNNLVSFVGYNSNVEYGANFYAAQHNGNLYQDLVTVGSVPEPSSVALGGIGFTLVVLWGRFRNRRSA